MKVYVVEIRWGGVDQDKDNWRALVNAVMKIQIKQQAPWLLVHKRIIPTEARRW
jgi:hypothetical protein